MKFKNTGQMCMITEPDANREEGFRFVDLGNYFFDAFGRKCLVTTKENAIKYGDRVDVPIYIRARGQS